MGIFSARILPCLCVAAASLAAPCQLEPAKVQISYTNEGASLKAVLEDLSKDSKVALAADASLYELPLVIHLKDATLKDLMDRIAIVTYSDWTKEKDGYRLKASAQRLQKAYDDAYQARLATYRKALEIRRKAVSEYETFDEKAADLLGQQIEAMLKSQNAEAGIDALVSKSPGRRLMNRLIASLAPEILAGPAPGERVVLSLRPNRMQRAFPKQTEQILSLYAKEQELWVKTVTAASAGTTQIPWRLQESLRAHDPALKPILAIDTVEFTGSLSFTLTMLDRHSIAQSSFRDEMYPTTDEPQITPSQPRKDIDKEPIKVEPVVAELGMRLWLHQSATLPEWMPPSSALVERLLHPEKFEPLQLGTGQLLVSIARKQNRQLVACPPDPAITIAAHAHRRGKSLAEVWEELVAYWLSRKPSSAEDGWITMTWRPTSHSLGYGRPMPRSFMGRMMRQIKDDDRMTLDTLCNIALELDTVDTVIQDFSRCVTSDIFAGHHISSASWIAFYRLHGSFTPEQRQTLKDGGALNFTTLTPFQRTLLAKMLYSPGGLNNYNLPRDVVTEGLRYSNYPEATEIFADGLPTGLEIRCEVESKDSVGLRRDYGTARVSEDTMDLQWLAGQMYREPEGSNTLNGGTVLGYRVSKTTEYTYRIAYSPYANSGRGMSDFAPVGEWVKKYEDLPEKIRAEIKKHMDDRRKAGGGGGR